MADGRRSVSKTTQGEEQKEEKSDLEKFMELILTKMEENNNKIETKLIHLDENNKKMRIKLDETSQKAEGNSKSLEQKLEENSQKTEENNQSLEKRLGEKLEITLEKMEEKLEENSQKVEQKLEENNRKAEENSQRLQKKLEQTSKRLEDQIEQRINKSIGEVKMLYEEMMNKHETLETKLTSENQEIVVQIQQHKERINMVEEEIEKEAEWTNKRFMMVDENISEIKKEQKTSKEKEDQLENKWKIEMTDSGSDTYLSEDGKRKGNEFDGIFSKSRKVYRSPDTKNAGGRENEITELMKTLITDNKKKDKELEDIKNMVEICQKERKKNNLIMKGLPISTSDMEQLKNEIGNFLNKELRIMAELNKVQKINDNMCIIEFSNFEDKLRVLKAKSNLRSYRQHRVYIECDVTLKEIDMQKNLRHIAAKEKANGKRIIMGYGFIVIEDTKWRWNHSGVIYKRIGKDIQIIG
ncbi:golgin subfamily A member 6-like protein 6 [Diabrotica virgifera virgifera]|uniref:RRM domain-containing protein n=1 Tax=Diabrotica virgifera virgifera TaxID=50390 RepID=A0ABM5L4D6_DIAVI|nr:golgin subfamily A member 6-like protein 6 [Diabrotica virgifera virgifera]